MSDLESKVCASPDCSQKFEPAVWNQKYCDIRCKRDVENLRRRELVEDFVDKISSRDGEEDDDDYREALEQVEFLRRENKRLSNLYTKHKSNTGEVVNAVYEAAESAFGRLDLKPVRAPSKSSQGRGTELVANPSLADFQIGKVTRSYDKDVCRERIETFADKVIELTEIQRQQHEVSHCVIHILGDIVEGEDVFPGQAYEINISLYEQIISGVEILSDFIRRMLSEFKTVHVAAVLGNHGWLTGRSGRYNPESNMDRLLYKFVSMLFANEPRITFDIPDGYGERNWYTVDYIGTYGTLLLHGDQLPAPTSQHGYYKKVLGWKTSGIPEPFDDVKMGHYHQNTKSTFGETVLRIVGTPESDNTYAQERIGVMGRPSQHLQFVEPDRGVVAESDVYLD